MAVIESDLNIQLQEGEGATLEYKERLSSSFGRELEAMANTLGGGILLGVRDDGTEVGIADSNPIRARILDIARHRSCSVECYKAVQCSEGFFWHQGANASMARGAEPGK